MRLTIAMRAIAFELSRATPPHAPIVIAARTYDGVREIEITLSHDTLYFYLSIDW